jgi:hypothetical protein
MIVRNLLIYCYLLFSLFGAETSYGQTKLDESTCLVIDGGMEKTANGMSTPATVELITGDGVIETITLSGEKQTFKFYLSHNQWYAIRIKREGYIPRLISVNTHMPFDNDFIYKFSFRTSLIPVDELKNVDLDAADFPVAIIHYNAEFDDFSHSEAYTNYIKQLLFQFNRSGSHGTINNDF